MKNTLRRAVCAGAILALAALLVPTPALAYEWTRRMEEGDSGPDVKALQIRVAGWFPQGGQRTFLIDGVYSEKTTNSVKAFQAFYGLTADGVAGEDTLAMLDSFEDSDGSTIHFDFSEFKQNTNSACSAKANAYAGTFGGGMVSATTAKRNVKRLMWRLEAVRAKGGGKSIGINSGFRSVAYNDCIGGARASQHMYGTAADNRMAETDNRLQRDLARVSQIHGIGCYRSLSHNHFDIRIENKHLPSSQFWWWPEQDGKGRDLDESDQPCYGEYDHTDADARPFAAPVDGSGRAIGGSAVPSAAEVRAFEAAGEPSDLGAAD